MKPCSMTEASTSLESLIDWSFQPIGIVHAAVVVVIVVAVVADVAVVSVVVLSSLVVVMLLFLLMLVYCVGAPWGNPS